MDALHRFGGKPCQIGEVGVYRERNQSRLRKNLKRLMVCKSVNVKELKHIKGRMHCNCALDKCIILMCRQEMNGPINGIEMNNGEMWIASIVGVRFDHPKSCLVIRFGAHMRIPLNQCRGIFFIFVLERKEKENARYFKPTNTFNLGI